VDARAVDAPAPQLHRGRAGGEPHLHRRRHGRRDGAPAHDVHALRRGRGGLGRAATASRADTGGGGSRSPRLGLRDGRYDARRKHGRRARLRRHLATGDAYAGTALQPRGGRPRGQDLRARRLPRRQGTTRGLRLRRSRRSLVDGGAAAAADARVRRRRLRRRNLGAGRAPGRGGPPRRLDLRPAGAPVAPRPGDAEADGAARRGSRRRRDPRRLGVDLPDLRRAHGDVARRPDAARDPARVADVLRRRRCTTELRDSPVVERRRLPAA
jgi:hypothetical protein